MDRRDEMQKQWMGQIIPVLLAAILSAAGSAVGTAFWLQGAIIKLQAGQSLLQSGQDENRAQIENLASSLDEYRREMLAYVEKQPISFQPSSTVQMQHPVIDLIRAPKGDDGPLPEKAQR